MLAPHELKNKPFKKSLNGYNTAEVDEYIAFLIDKYTEVYRENNELDRKLRIVVTNLDEIKDEEASIRSTLISAQKMAEKIERDATERADIITGAIRDRCDAVIAEFKKQLADEKEEMWTIRTRILDFKKDVFELYGKHIDELKNLSVNEIEEIVLPDESKIVTKIFTDVKGTIESEMSAQKKRDGEKLQEAPRIAETQETKPKAEAPAVDAHLTAEESKAEDEYLKLMMDDTDDKSGKNEE